jgi:hypothetical protein
MSNTMKSFQTFDNDVYGPEPLMRALDATPCRRAMLALAGRIGLSPELIAYHRREAERLRQTALRHAWRKLKAKVVQLIRRAH